MCGSQKFGNVAVVRWHNNENNEVAPFVYLDEKRQRLPQLCCRHVPLRPHTLGCEHCCRRQTNYKCVCVCVCVPACAKQPVLVLTPRLLLRFLTRVFYALFFLRRIHDDDPLCLCFCLSCPSLALLSLSAAVSRLSAPVVYAGFSSRFPYFIQYVECFFGSGC